MAVISIETEKKIIHLLKNQGAMSIDDLVDELFKKDQISERKVKETILRLREEGRLKPNHQWKMEYIR